MNKKLPIKINIILYVRMSNGKKRHDFTEKLALEGK